MRKLLEQIQQDQSQLTEINWRQLAGGTLLATNLLTGVPSVDAKATVPQKQYQVDKDSDIVAKVIAGEAAGEGYIGMKAVACVIQNRAGGSNRMYYDPIDIVTKPHQFSAYNDKNLMNRNYSKVKKEADELASQIGKLDDITDGATFYMTKEVYDKKMAMVKSWVHGKKFIKQIGDHVFLK